MKILMAVMMTLAMTSAFGDCKLNETCSETDCKALNSSYALVGGKCTDPAAGETKTKCGEIVSSNAPKGTESAAPASGSDATSGTGK